jgi:biopolymer transport protein ExbB/TolQ
MFFSLLAEAAPAKAAEAAEFSIGQAFEEGGVMMWPILVITILVWGLAIERFIYLFFKSGVNKDALLARVQNYILAGDLASATRYIASQSFPLARIIHAGLIKANDHDDEHFIQAAVDEAALRELPRIEKRTAYLAMLANVAMLTGLLGTISGMISSFAAVATAEAADKATKLAAGISEAMNCTAFGLIAAVPALLLYAILQGRTQSLVDDINEGTVRAINFVMANLEKLKKKPT